MSLCDCGAKTCNFRKWHLCGLEKDAISSPLTPSFSSRATDTDGDGRSYVRYMNVELCKIVLTAVEFENKKAAF